MINRIISNLDNKDVNQALAIILRAWYEEKNMKSANLIRNFELKQMDGFEVYLKNNDFILVFKNDCIIISDKKIEELVNEIYNYYNDKYKLNIDYRIIDPVFFSLFFYDTLDKIIDVKYDTINIANIELLRYKSKPVNLSESERYKALLDRNYQMYSPFKSNLIIDNPRNRLDKIYNSVKNKGYGYNNQYAIFYNDEPYIRDGQHRVCSLKYLYGNIDIKILRVYLKNNFFYE